MMEPVESGAFDLLVEVTVNREWIVYTGDSARAANAIVDALVRDPEVVVSRAARVAALRN